MGTAAASAGGRQMPPLIEAAAVPRRLRSLQRYILPPPGRHHPQRATRAGAGKLVQAVQSTLTRCWQGMTLPQEQQDQQDQQEQLRREQQLLLHLGGEMWRPPAASGLPLLFALRAAQPLALLGRRTGGRLSQWKRAALAAAGMAAAQPHLAAPMGAVSLLQRV
jgi:hypothetical protein